MADPIGQPIWLAASHNAEVDLKRAREPYRELGISDNFDAAVISKNK